MSTPFKTLMYILLIGLAAFAKAEQPNQGDTDRPFYENVIPNILGSWVVDNRILPTVPFKCPQSAKIERTDHPRCIKFSGRFPVQSKFVRFSEIMCFQGYLTSEYTMSIWQILDGLPEEITRIDVENYIENTSSDTHDIYSIYRKENVARDSRELKISFSFSKTQTQRPWTLRFQAQFSPRIRELSQLGREFSFDCPMILHTRVSP